MRHAAAWLALAAAACAPSEPPRPVSYDGTVEPIGSAASPAEACANLAQVKVAFEDPAYADLAALDARHEEIRRGAAPATPEAPRFLRVLIGGGMTNEGPGGPESVVASKDAAGAWQVSRIYHSYRSPPSPEYPMPPQWPQPAGMGEKQGVFEPGDWTVIHQAGALTAEQGAALEARLAAPCFGQEPAYLPRELPLSSGAFAMCPHDPIFWSLEVREAGAARVYGRPCRLIGPVGAVIALISSAPVRQIPAALAKRSDVYAADSTPTLEETQAFVAAVLPGALFRSGDGAPARIVSYTPGKACDGTLRIQPAGEGAAVDLYRDWDAIRSFPGWPDGADSVLDRGDGVDRFTFDGTTMAMMFDGAMGGFSFLCREPES